MTEYLFVFDRITRMVQAIHAKDKKEATALFEEWARVTLLGECEIAEIIDYQLYLSLFCPNCGAGLKDGICYNWRNCSEGKIPEIRYDPK